MYTLHCFLGVSNLEHAPVDLTCVRKERCIKQKLDKKKSIKNVRFNYCDRRPVAFFAIIKTSQ